MPLGITWPFACSFFSLSELETDVKVFKETILEILDEEEVIEELCLSKWTDEQVLYVYFETTYILITMFYLRRTWTLNWIFTAKNQKEKVFLIFFNPNACCFRNSCSCHFGEELHCYTVGNSSWHNRLAHLVCDGMGAGWQKNQMLFFNINQHILWAFSPVSPK